MRTLQTRLLAIPQDNEAAPLWIFLPRQNRNVVRKSRQGQIQICWIINHFETKEKKFVLAPKNRLKEVVCKLTPVHQKMKKKKVPTKRHKRPIPRFSDFRRNFFDLISVRFNFFAIVRNKNFLEFEKFETCGGISGPGRQDRNQIRRNIGTWFKVWQKHVA